MPKRRVKKVSGEVESERLLVTPSMLYVGTPGTWDCRAVNASSFPIDLVMLTQANQHRMVQLPPPQRLANRAVDANTSCHCRSPWIGAGLPTGCLFEAQTEFH